MQRDVTTAKGVNGNFLTAVVRYVERVLGPEAAVDVIARAGIERAPGNGEWTTVADTVAVADHAAELLGEVDIGWRAGEELMRMTVEEGLDAFLRAEGTVTAAFAAVAAYGSKMSSGRLIRLVEAGEHNATFEATYSPMPPHRFFCRLQAAYYAQLPALFGASGYVAEPRCQLEGDDVCRFEVRWTDPVVGPDQARTATAASDRILRWFEDMEAIASDLARAQDSKAALETILARVGTMAMAPRYVLAVRLDDTEPMRVHSLGLDHDDAHAIATRIEEGDRVTSAGVALVADITGSTRYGFLAAILAPGTEPTEADRRLLQAYAQHAASVLETAHALEQARHDRDSARALLSLAHSLSAAKTATDVAQIIVDSVPTVVGDGHASVWLWNDEDATLTLGAVFPVTAAAGPPPTFTPATAPGLLALRAHPRPLLLSRDTVDLEARELLAAQGDAEVAVAPIVARGDLLGVLAISFDVAVEVGRRDYLFERLGGLADLAAAALDNARLLARVQHQALHDALTGLPNRTLAATRATDALAEATGGTGILFVDLDDFKTVNDRFGHAWGDEVLRLAVARMTTQLRPDDVLTRFAGDEFVVILPELTGPDDAERVADRLREAFAPPMTINGTRVVVTASVGVAYAPHDGIDYETLLHVADTAMYDSKQMSRRCIQVAS